MVPDKFDMVDMGGIDLIESQGVAVEGLYQKLVDSTAQCRYQCLYNWKFNGILIPPSYVEMEVREDGVWINEGVSVDEDDVVHIYSIEPEPPAPVEPEIQQLTITENGEYYAPVGVDGYNPVIANVPLGNTTYSGETAPDVSLGVNGDWYIQNIIACEITRLGFDTGIDVSNVYGFKFIFEPISGITPYQSYLLANLDNFTIGRTGNYNRCYIRIAGSERMIFETDGITTVEAKNGIITVGATTGTYDSSNPLGSPGNVYIGAKTADRYSDFLFKSLELYNSDLDTIDRFYYDPNTNSIVGNNGALSPVGTGEVTRYDGLTTVYHKENNIWVRY